MTFLNYCIATKNYSSIKILKDYVNTFSKNKGNTSKKIIGASLGLTGLAGLGLAGKKLYDKNKETETPSESTHYEVSQPVSDNNTEVHDEQDQSQIQSNDSMSKLLQDLNEEFKDTDGISIEYR